MSSTKKKATAKKAPAKKATAKKAPAKKATAKKAPVVATTATTEEPTVPKGQGTFKAPLMATLQLAQLRVIKGANPRSQSGPITELTASIKQDGLLSSLVVRPGAKSTYEIVAGERRFRALTDLQWEHPIPCQIRLDLEDDDVRALAVAVAENSDDARTALSSLDLGRACAKLEESGWTPARIAKTVGYHPQRVRRAIMLAQGPTALRKKIEEGLSERAALEILKVPDEARQEIIAQVNSETSAADIARLRKVISNQIAAKVDSGETKGGAKPAKKIQALPTSWRGAREKQVALATLANELVELHDKETGTLAEDEAYSADYYEYRGALAWALWDRGDLDTPYLPSDANEDASSLTKNKQFLVMARNAATTNVD